MGTQTVWEGILSIFVGILITWFLWPKQETEEEQKARVCRSEGAKIKPTPWLSYLGWIFITCGIYGIAYVCLSQYDHWLLLGLAIISISGLAPVFLYYWRLAKSDAKLLERVDDPSNLI